MTNSSPRKFFSKLRYSENIDIQTDHHQSTDGYPVFSTVELNKLPLKWLKYLLLARLGLRSMQGLKQDIHRFPITGWILAKEYCDGLLTIAKKDEITVLLVVKLIPMDRAGQLPNFRITSLDHLNQTFEALKSSLSPEYQEVWVCQTIIDHNTSSFAGRLTIPGHKNYSASWLEIVWFTSPRMLESVDWDNSSFPSLRSFRAVDGFRFQIEKFHIPQNTIFGYEGTHQRCLQDFMWLKYKIAEYKEKIDALEAIVAAAGAKELCLEFKVDNGQFRFIDWDTEVETVNLPDTLRYMLKA